ncbi:DUF4349 domain-containing protein [Mycolicibacterium sp.]|uniref:DUF4349 domain-containing protein n=1 Tax=Mycolicibacterium sp. TaxID=2320850 RepID=UPI003D0A2583
MNQLSRSSSLVIAGVAALSILTGCAGSNPPPNLAPAERPATGGAAMDSVAGPAPEFGPPQAPPEERDVVKTASMTLTVADPSGSADEAAVIVEKADGRVDSRTEDAGSGSGRAVTSITLRVPVAKLDEVMRQLKTLGTVETATTTAEDVTAQRVDLDARIRALQTSVDRLLAIMRDARDPEALITAESALSERQAELDSLRAQREALGDRIAYSTVDVSFYAEHVGGPAPKRYEGFSGQIERGWDAMVAVASGAVLMFGLLLPWLAVLAVVGILVFVIVRWAQRRAAPPPPPAAPVESDDSGEPVAPRT